jgi:hypothetical protein
MNLGALVVFVVSLSASAVRHATAGGAEAPGGESSQKGGLTFGARLHNIISHAKDPNDDHEFVDNPLMQEMLKQPVMFAKDIEEYLLMNPRMTRTEAWVSMTALQCLPLTQYLSLLRRLAGIKHGKVEQWVLFYGVAPGFEWSIRLAKNYQKPEVRGALLSVAKSQNATANLREAVIQILAGTSARNLAAQKWVPTLRCGSN